MAGLLIKALKFKTHCFEKEWTNVPHPRSNRPFYTWRTLLAAFWRAANCCQRVWKRLR